MKINKPRRENLHPRPQATWKFLHLICWFHHKQLLLRPCSRDGRSLKTASQGGERGESLPPDQGMLPSPPTLPNACRKAHTADANSTEATVHNRPTGLSTCSESAFWAAHRTTASQGQGICPRPDIHITPCPHPRGCTEGGTSGIRRSWLSTTDNLQALQVNWGSLNPAAPAQ